MQNNSDAVQKAKRYVRRYKIWCAVMGVCTVLGYCAISFYGNVLWALAVSLSIIFVGSPILFNRCILSILNQKLDADTYLSAVYQGKFDTPSALWQLYGEYFCGRYQNAINICKMKSEDPKTPKRYQYYYLTYLANVYFDIGDDANLRKVYEQYEAAFANEKPRRQAYCRKRFPRMAFYGFYLNQNIEACIAWLNTPAPAIINQYHRTFCKARLALLQGNTEEAVGYYETLAKEVPQLNYGKLAMKYLADMGNEAFHEQAETFVIANEPTETVLYPANRRKLRTILCVCFFVFVLFFSVALILKVFDSEKKYEREMAAYRESIRVLVEQDHDDVEILDTFALKNGEEIVDTMFICKTDTDIIVGCIYVYDDPTEQYYKNMADISIASLKEERSPLWYCSFPSKTSHNQIESYFYTVEADVPTEYCHLSAFEINGKTVYYVITEIVPGIVITLPNK